MKAKCPICEKSYWHDLGTAILLQGFEGREGKGPRVCMHQCLHCGYVLLNIPHESAQKAHGEPKAVRSPAV